MVLSSEDRSAKLKALAEIEGYDDVDEILVAVCSDSISPAICTNGGCSYTTEMEPDQREGWCERCYTNSVQSALVLANLI